MKDYIYIICNEDEYVKIGVSKHPHKRLKQLQTGNQSKLQLFHIEEFECNRKHLLQIESKLHKDCQYLCKHINGEWYKIPVENLEKLKSLVIYYRIRYENDSFYFNNLWRMGWK